MPCHSALHLLHQTASLHEENMNYSYAKYCRGLSIQYSLCDDLPLQMQGSLQDLQGIMQRTDEAMLAVTPCDNADTYFSTAILPHRVVSRRFTNHPQSL